MRIVEWIPSRPDPKNLRLVTGRDWGGRWYAHDENYCGCGDCEGGIMGGGATEQEAIDDFLEKLGVTV